MPCLIEENAVVLFQGDSITDAGRSREDDVGLGGGYANMAAAWFSAIHPGRGVRFLNRGISGNRVGDLQARLQEDCIGLKPTWVSIMVGINDVGRRYSANNPTTAEQYEAVYRDLLTRVRDEVGARMVLCEPFLVPAVQELLCWREDLNPKIDVVRSLAREFAAALVPLDGLFAEACLHREPTFWSADSVHPTQPGHALIAQAWLQAVGAV